MKLAPRYDGPPVIAIAGPADDQRAPVVRQRRRLETTLAGLSADEWRAPSRCDGWTVHDVVAHLVGVNAFWAHSVTAGLGGTPSRLLTGFDPAATPPLMVEPMRALAPAEVLEQFVASNDGLLGPLAELDESGWSAICETPAGHVPVRLLAFHALWDAWIHERDIALPLGLAPAVEPDEVASALRYAAALSPGLALGAGNAGAGVFVVEASDPEVRFVLEVGDTVVLHDGADARDAPCLRGDAVTLVEVLSLRAPLPASAPGEWRALLAGLAAAFDADVA